MEKDINQQITAQMGGGCPGPSYELDLEDPIDFEEEEPEENVIICFTYFDDRMRHWTLPCRWRYFHFEQIHWVILWGKLKNVCKLFDKSPHHPPHLPQTPYHGFQPHPPVCHSDKPKRTWNIVATLRICPFDLLSMPGPGPGNFRCVPYEVHAWLPVTPMVKWLRYES